jgi:hypothetical protein
VPRPGKAGSAVPITIIDSLLRVHCQNSRRIEYPHLTTQKSIAFYGLVKLPPYSRGMKHCRRVEAIGCPDVVGLSLN